jgi:hypothetical protein
MDTLRKPFLVLALVLIVLAVLIEMGAVGFIGGTTVSDSVIETTIREQAADDLKDKPFTERELEIQRRIQRVKEEQLAESGARPGVGIPYLALLDLVVAFSAGLIGLSLVLKQSTQARVQGCATLIFSLLLLLAGIVLLIVAISLLLFMLGLLASPPFGTITYIALFAFFNKGGALITLTLLLFLKLGFGGSLLAAQQGFLKNKGLVLIVATSIVANIIVMLLHGLVPGFLASVTDAIAAIVVAVLALLWTIFLLFGSIFSVLRAVKPG